MHTIFTFQHGEFYNSTSDWISIASLLTDVIGAIATIFAIYYAYSLYQTQRKDTADDAFALFQASLEILEGAVEKSITQLSEFQKSLGNENDDFINPSLPVNLNDKFLSRIDLTNLSRFYKQQRADKLETYLLFIKKSSYLGVYHDFFLNELNNFRGEFSNKEAKFQQHNLLTAIKYNNVLAGLKTGITNDEFKNGYVDMLKALSQNTTVLDFDAQGVGALKNRKQLVEQFVKPLTAHARKFAYLDPNANDVYQIGNEIIGAREELDKLKQNWSGQFLKDSIANFKEIQVIIQKLIEKTT